MRKRDDYIRQICDDKLQKIVKYGSFTNMKIKSLKLYFISRYNLNTNIIFLILVYFIPIIKAI